MFSRITESFLYIGDQTVAYSRWGLTIDLQRHKNISLFKYVKHLNMSPRFLLAIADFWLYGP